MKFEYKSDKNSPWWQRAIEGASSILVSLSLLGLLLFGIGYLKLVTLEIFNKVMVWYH